MSQPSGPDEPDEAPTDEQSERRRRVMERLAEMLQGPSPERSGSGAVAGGGFEEALAGLGLGLSDEDTARVAGAVADGPDPEEVAALFQALLEGFQAWQRKPRPADETEETDGDDG